MRNLILILLVLALIPISTAHSQTEPEPCLTEGDYDELHQNYYNLFYSVDNLEFMSPEELLPILNDMYLIETPRCFHNYKTISIIIFYDLSSWFAVYEEYPDLSIESLGLIYVYDYALVKENYCLLAPSYCIGEDLTNLDEKDLDTSELA